jgi:hypothetical protein
MDLKGIPRELPGRMFHCNAKITASIGSYLANFADRAREQRNVVFGHAPRIIDQKDIAAGHRLRLAEHRHALVCHLVADRHDPTRLRRKNVGKQVGQFGNRGKQRFNRELSFGADAS